IALAAAAAAQQATGRAAPSPAALPVENAVLTDAPNVPPPIARKHPARVVVELRAYEVIAEIADGVKYTLWTFGGHQPGKFIRVRKGDVVEFRLSNDPANRMPHNIDLHAVTGPGGGAAVTLVQPGEEAVFEWKALKAGLYVYHCATAPVPMHLSNGMTGLILVEPEQGLPPVDREYYIMQHEFYTQRPDVRAADVRTYTGSEAVARAPEAEVFEFSLDKALAENPDYVVWNGRVGSLTGAGALKARVGERVRFYVGNSGLNHVASFHIIGDHLERVYREGDLESPPARDIQNTLIPAGAAVVVETRFEAPGSYILVDHSLIRAFNKGGVGVIEVSGPPAPDVFRFVERRALPGATVAAAPPTRHAAAEQTLRACSSCHDLSPARRRLVGPPLFGVYRARPTIEGVPYATWDDRALDEWLSDPFRVKPRTAMAYKVGDPEARRAIIEALKALRDGNGAGH
ncbi:MAG TPA: copper-containing nitrite reductase, partial [Thermodesulfobacteriota bacterium]|nr:copper-containing nitrite reductase [Thermodesulfobacteriota bacterium]